MTTLEPSETVCLVSLEGWLTMCVTSGARAPLCSGPLMIKMPNLWGNVAADLCRLEENRRVTREYAASCFQSLHWCWDGPLSPLSRQRARAGEGQTLPLMGHVLNSLGVWVMWSLSHPLRSASNLNTGMIVLK